MTPDPTEWLVLDEQECIMLIERFYRNCRDQAPAPKAHAAIHAVRETLARLMVEGLDRH